MVCTQLNLSKKDDITTNCDDNDDHHHELQHCLLKETSSKHVGGWCFFLRYLFTSPPRQSYRQWHLTLSTFSRQWCWLTKVVLPRSSQQHCGYNTIILTSRELWFCSQCVFCSSETLSHGTVVFYICWNLWLNQIFQPWFIDTGMSLTN